MNAAAIIVPRLHCLSSAVARRTCTSWRRVAAAPSFSIHIHNNRTTTLRHFTTSNNNNDDNDDDDWLQKLMGESLQPPAGLLWKDVDDKDFIPQGKQPPALRATFVSERYCIAVYRSNIHADSHDPMVRITYLHPTRPPMYPMYLLQQQQQQQSHSTPATVVAVNVSWSCAPVAP